MKVWEKAKRAEGERIRQVYKEQLEKSGGNWTAFKNTGR